MSIHSVVMMNVLHSEIDSKSKALNTLSAEIDAKMQARDEMVKELDLLNKHCKDIVKCEDAYRTSIQNLWKDKPSLKRKRDERLSKCGFKKACIIEAPEK